MGAVREVPLGGDIQSVIDAGPGEVLLTADVATPYNITTPLIMRRGVTLRGASHGAVIKATAAMDAVIRVGNGTSIDHWAIRGLTVDGNNQAVTGVDVNISGTSGNFKSGEPDSRGRISDIEVWDTTANGIWTRGSDAQAIRTAGVRVRRAGLYGFLVESPDLWFTDCEATTSTSSADANRPGAAFGIYSSNCHFKGCKGWYSRSHGFHVKGTRNFLNDSEAQDCAKHGFFVEWDKNSFVGCVADTCSTSLAGGTAGAYDGFYVTPASQMVMTGCLSFDRQPGGAAKGQRYGFNIPGALDTDGLFAANTGWNNLTGVVNLR